MAARDGDEDLHEGIVGSLIELEWVGLLFAVPLSIIWLVRRRRRKRGSSPH